MNHCQTSAVSIPALLRVALRSAAVSLCDAEGRALPKVWFWLRGRPFASLIDTGLCACSRSCLAMPALTPVHTPTRRHFTLTNLRKSKESVLTPAGCCRRLALPGVRFVSQSPYLTALKFSKERRLASSA